MHRVQLKVLFLAAAHLCLFSFGGTAFMACQDSTPTQSPKRTAQKKRISRPAEVAKPFALQASQNTGQNNTGAFAPTWSSKERKRLIKVREDRKSSPFKISRRGLKTPKGKYQVEVVSGPIYGLLSKTKGAGPLKTVYRPNADYYGYDELDFTLTFKGKKTLGPYTLPIHVLAVNDPPHAVPPSSLVTTEDTPIESIILKGWDIEDGESSLRAKVIRPPRHGKLSAVFGQSPLSLVYTPDADFHGPDAFRFRITDKDGAPSKPANVSIEVRPIEDAPKAVAPRIVVLKEDETSDRFTLRGKDIEGGENRLKVEVVDVPLHGTLSNQYGSAPLTIRYTPNENFFGEDSLRFRVRNSEGTPSAVRKVTFQIKGVPDPPESTPPGTISVYANAPSNPFTLSGWDVEDRSDQLLVKVTKNPSSGFLSKSKGKAPLVLVYTPKSEFVGEDSFSYRVEDQDGKTSSTIDVPIEVIFMNTAPTIKQLPNLEARLGEEFGYQIKAIDPDQWTVSKDRLTYTISEGELPNWLTLDPDTGLLSGTPSENDSETVAGLEVKVTDQKGAFALSNVFRVRTLQGHAVALTVDKEPPVEVFLNDTIPTFTFSLIDRFGNIDTTDQETRVRLIKEKGPGNVRGPINTRAKNGLVVFAGLSINRIGEYQLTLQADRGGKKLERPFEDTINIIVKPHPPLRLSSGRILETTEIATSIQLADLNGDGHFDIVTANKKSDDLSIHWGKGDGVQFVTEHRAAENGPSDLIIDNFSDNGAQLLVVSHQYAHTANIYTISRDGRFNKTQTLETEREPIDLEHGDLNSDSLVDFVAVNHKSNSASIFHQVKDGRFRLKQVIETASRPIRVRIGDVNGDKRNDIAILHKSVGFIFLYLGTNLQTFGPPVRIPVPKGLVDFSIYDGNEDHPKDFLLLDRNAHQLHLYHGSDHLLEYERVQSINTAQDPTRMLTRDVNQDGKMDLLVNSLSSSQIHLLLSDPDKGFRNSGIIATGPSPGAFATGTLNPGDELDLVVSTSASNEAGERFSGLTLHLGREDIIFDSSIHYGDGVDSSAMVVGDLNQDGLLDMVSADALAGDVLVFLQDKYRGFVLSDRLDVAPNPSVLSLRDFNGDGFLDIAVGDSELNKVFVHRGDGKGDFQSPSSFSSGKGLSALRSIDLNEDNNQDLAIALSRENAVGLYFGKGTGKFKRAVKYAVGKKPKFIFLRDVNSDGRADVLTVNRQSKDISILLYQDDGRFKKERRIPLNVFPVDVKLARLTDDASWDLIVLGKKRIHVLRGTSKGFFHPLESFAAPRGSTSIGIADMNRDDKNDLILNAYPFNQVIVFLGSGNGLFGQGQPFLSGLGPAQILVADMNRDGNADIITANAEQGNFAWVLGR